MRSSAALGSFFVPTATAATAAVAAATALVFLVDFTFVPDDVSAVVDLDTAALLDIFSSSLLCFLDASLSQIWSLSFFLMPDSSSSDFQKTNRLFLFEDDEEGSFVPENCLFFPPPLPSVSIPYSGPILPYVRS
jgi:hypothetical protein